MKYIHNGRGQDREQTAAHISEGVNKLDKMVSDGRMLRSNKIDGCEVRKLRTMSFAATKLNCSKDHIVELVNDGDLRYVDIARAGSKHREIRFTDEQLDEFAMKRTRQRSPLPSKNLRARGNNILAGTTGKTFEDRIRSKYGFDR